MNVPTVIDELSRKKLQKVERRDFKYADCAVRVHMISPNSYRYKNKDNFSSISISFLIFYTFEARFLLHMLAVILHNLAYYSVTDQVGFFVSFSLLSLVFLILQIVFYFFFSPLFI